MLLTDLSCQEFFQGRTITYKKRLDRLTFSPKSHPIKLSEKCTFK